MAQKNAISQSIDPAVKQAVLDGLVSIRQQLANLLQVNLSPADRKEMLKMGDKTLAFVGKAIDYATAHPELVPPYLDLAEAKKDFGLSSDLLDISQELEALSTSVTDSLMLSGSEAYSAALMFFTSVKGAEHTDLPGTQSIREDLAQRFPGRPHKKDDTKPA